MTGKRQALINKRMKPHLLNSQRCYIHFNCINQWKIFRTNFKSSIVLFVKGDNVIRWPFDCFMLFWKMNFPHGRNFSCLGKELAIRDVPRIFVFPKFLPSMHHANVDKAFVFFSEVQMFGLYQILLNSKQSRYKFRFQKRLTLNNMTKSTCIALCGDNRTQSHLGLDLIGRNVSSAATE